jgi:hypothetical protein
MIRISCVALLAGYAGEKAWMAYMVDLNSSNWWMGLGLMSVVLVGAVSNQLFSRKRTILSVASGIVLVLVGLLGYSVATL